MTETGPLAGSALGCLCCLPSRAAGPGAGGLTAGGPTAGGVGRRRFVRAGVGAITATAVLGPGLTRPAAAQSTLSPDAALQTLMDGNQRFYEHRLVSFDEDLALLKKKTVEKQEPYAAILSCADSRVPVELVFDQTIGQLFVTRVAGNVAVSTVIASLEYGAAVLGTKVILVLGHANCGAVKAAMSGKAVPGQISRLFASLQPAVAAAHGDLETAIKDNARFQAQLLTTASPVLSELVKAGNLKIVSGYYALDTGVVTLLG